MSLVDVTRQAVIDAVAEYDQLGRDEFLRKHGVANDDGFFFDHQGRLYDTKAVVAVAHKIVTGGASEPSVVSAGVGSRWTGTCAGFVSKRRTPPWASSLDLDRRA